MLLYGNERDILPKLLQFEMTADITAVTISLIL
jgi:hypothetical protein